MNKAVNFRYHSVGRLKHNISMKAIECVGKIQFYEYMVLRHSSDIFSCCMDCRLTFSWSGNANLQWGKERGQLIDCISAYLLAHLAATLLRVYPIAIGLRPPDFLVSAMRLPPNNMGLTSIGQAPRSKMLVNPVISFRSAEDVSRWLTSSRRCWGRRPSGPPAEPDGKERMVASTSDSSTWYGIVVLGLRSNVPSKLCACARVRAHTGRKTRTHKKTRSAQKNCQKYFCTKTSF